MSLVSVIVPVYNTEKYLTECIDSITAQTYSKIEILLVDDGSTDQSGDIAHRKAGEDPRIIVVRQTNQGVSSARNKGVEMARGEYVCFIDADDWIEPDMIENLVKAARMHQSDLVLSGWHNYFARQESPQIMFPCGTAEIPSVVQPVTRFELVRAFMLHDNGSFPAGKLFRRAIIKQYSLMFDQHVSIGEDYLFLLRFIAAGSLFTCVRQAYYHYRYVSGSTINRYNPLRLQYYRQIDTLKRSLIDTYWAGNRELVEMADAYFTKRLLACLYHETMTRNLLPNYGIVREIVAMLAGKEVPKNNQDHKAAQMYYAAIRKGQTVRVWLMLSLQLYRRRLI